MSNKFINMPLHMLQGRKKINYKHRILPEQTIVWPCKKNIDSFSVPISNVGTKSIVDYDVGNCGIWVIDNTAAEIGNDRLYYFIEFPQEIDGYIGFLCPRQQIDDI